MSLVMMFSLFNGDVLFVGDKNNVVKDQDGLIVSRTTDLIKLIRYSNGVMGFAGKSNLAQDMLRSMAPLTPDESDIPLAIQGRLLAQYLRLTKQMTKEMKNESMVEFLFSNGPDCMYIFKSFDNFSPQSSPEWGAIGAPLLPMVIYQLFTAPEAINLDQAKRLAAIQLLAASDVDPTAVSQKMDMWLLRTGTSEPEELKDTDDVCEWVRRYIKTMTREFYHSGIDTPKAAGLGSDKAQAPPTAE